MISKKVIERLIIYRSFLNHLVENKRENVFSHQLAEHCGLTATRVRRDLMHIGFIGNYKAGYRVDLLIAHIRDILEPREGIPLALIGVGNLGRAILTYFSRQNPQFRLVASFDNDPQKIGRVIAGCRCHDLDQIVPILSENPVQTAIITVPATAAQSVADQLVRAGVTGIVNFSPVSLKVPQHVAIEYIDFGLIFEKVAYFSRKSGLTQASDKPIHTALNGAVPRTEASGFGGDHEN